MENGFGKYKENVAEEFEKEYLVPQLGEGDIKKGLLNGLVKILDDFTVKGEKKQKYPNLEKSINHEKLFQMEYDKEREKNLKRSRGLSVRLLNGLKALEINSPLDLMKITYNVKDNYGFRKTCEGKDGKEFYLGILSKFRNLGENSIGLFIDYLESEGFDFSREYLEEVMGSV